MRQEMFRHARDEQGMPQATLATIREGNVIYFGIALCSKKDVFSKKLGRMISMNRARKVQQTSLEVFNGISFSDNGLRGICDTEHVQDLLDQFRVIARR